MTLIVHCCHFSSPRGPAHLCLLSLMFLIMSVTPLCFRIQFVLFLSLRVTPTMILHLPLGCDQFLKLGVAKRPGLTAICHYWEYTFVKCFPLQSHWHIFVSHDVVQLAECTPSLSDFPFHFLYLVMVLSHHLPEIYVSVDLLDLLSIDNHIILVDMLLHITLVFPRCILRPTGLLMSWISWSISCSFEVELAMRTISSAKIRWDKYSPSILTPLFSQLILLMMAYCRHERKQFGRDVISLSGSSSKF